MRNFLYLFFCLYGVDTVFPWEEAVGFFVLLYTWNWVGTETKSLILSICFMDLIYTSFFLSACLGCLQISQLLRRKLSVRL